MNFHKHDRVSIFLSYFKHPAEHRPFAKARNSLYVNTHK